jgi:hypothetical protein
MGQHLSYVVAGAANLSPASAEVPHVPRPEFNFHKYRVCYPAA